MITETPPQAGDDEAVIRAVESNQSIDKDSPRLAGYALQRQPLFKSLLIGQLCKTNILSPIKKHSGFG
jgi:hypothetical protein